MPSGRVWLKVGATLAQLGTGGLANDKKPKRLGQSSKLSKDIMEIHEDPRRQHTKQVHKTYVKHP